MWRTNSDGRIPAPNDGVGRYFVCVNPSYPVTAFQPPRSVSGGRRVLLFSAVALLDSFSGPQGTHEQAPR